jgi:hypothetical protein
VVWGHPGTHQPERRRQTVEHVDLGGYIGVREQGLGGVEAGRSGADDRDAKGV